METKKKTTKLNNLQDCYGVAAKQLAKEMKGDDQSIRACAMALEGLYKNMKGHTFKFDGIKINKDNFKALVEESLRYV